MDQIIFEKLNNTNFQNWKFKIDLLLLKEGLCDVVTNIPPAEPDSDYLKLDGQARAIIGLAIEDNQLVHIQKLGSAKQYYDALKAYHEQRTVSSPILIMKSICQLRLEEGCNAEKHITTMKNLFDQLVSQGDNISDIFIVTLILGSLPKSYDPLITAFESRPENELTIDLVTGRIIHEYRRRGNNSN